MSLWLWLGPEGKIKKAGKNVTASVPLAASHAEVSKLAAKALGLTGAAAKVALY